MFLLIQVSSLCHNMYASLRVIETINFDQSLQVCHLQICPAVVKDPNDPGQTEVVCENYAWTPWGEWGRCSTICEDKGTRKRKRECHDMCKEESERTHHKDKCLPFHDTIQNKKFTDTDETHCSPCPAHLRSEWSQWGEWEKVYFISHSFKGFSV